MKLLQKEDRKWFGYGAVIGFVALSIALASVPRRGGVTDDTAIYQQLSEIRVSREASPNFDRDIEKLSNLEPKYRENLPLSKNPKLKGALERVSQRSYRYSSTR